MTDAFAAPRFARSFVGSFFGRHFAFSPRGRLKRGKIGRAPAQNRNWAWRVVFFTHLFAPFSFPKSFLFAIFATTICDLAAERLASII
ncbi:hypothetical protein [Alloprevotella tannerae]|uniref:hypothetical protein n=1 Tax=Alloprevotella tannerae TaxID=76122 RepID=UPI002600A45C|nr:hypothetical protein [Alloprevotella tannerae]